MTSMRPGGRTVIHHAKFSREVLVLLRFLLPANSRVHDPFAGTGQRIGDLASERGWHLTGTELEGPFIVDARIVQGNACDPSTYPAPVLCIDCRTDEPIVLAPASCTYHRLRGYSIVTSPVYPNGWGYRGNVLGVNRQMYWHIAHKAIAQWTHAEQVIVNMSDNVAGDRQVPVVGAWVAALEEAGWTDIVRHPVVTPRDRSSQHGERRVDNEVVLQCRRPS